MSDQYLDQWTWKTPISEEELQVLRSDFWQYFQKNKLTAPKACTCDGCPRENICVLSWDNYNTDGECLYDK